MKRRTFKQKFAKWCDEWQLALNGVWLALRNWKFVVVMLATFVFFGTLMNLLYDGLGVFGQFFKMDWGGKMMILGNAFLALFGVGRGFGEWMLTFFIALLQGILIGLVVLVWRKRRGQNSANVQNAGLVTGLAVLGSGCPTCGTTLLAPILGAISSTGGYALAGTLSNLLMIAAILVALWALKKVGLDAYAIIISERYKEKKCKKQCV